MLNHGPNQTLGCRPSLRHLPDVNACKSFGSSHERVPVQNGPSSKKPSEMGCRGALLPSPGAASSGSPGKSRKGLTAR